ncbi:MAG: PD-(D/E)XK nuclease family protein [Clostridiaceae bacterium]
MIYSQNSLNTYIQCPFKFFLKYKKSLSWKKDDDSDKEYFNSLESGLNFHMICERYYSNLPTGVGEGSEFYTWLERVKEVVPIEDGVRYLPEFEIRYNFENFILFSKLDLLKVSSDKIEIYDWKTENRILTYEKARNRLQTIIYLFIIGENAKLVYDEEIELDSITMNYYQPNLDAEPIVIRYNQEKHLENKAYIKGILSKINDLDEQTMVKNHKHCKICEFNYYCNNDIVEFQEYLL